MFSSGSQYDKGVNTFNQQGHLLQVEYAIEVQKQGANVVAVQGLNSVFICAELKRQKNEDVEARGLQKIYRVSDHIYIAVSGLIGDAETIVDKARIETTNHWFAYDEEITVKALTDLLSEHFLEFGEMLGDDDDEDRPPKNSRPYGVSILICGVDKTGPNLYAMNASGTANKYKAKGIGSGSSGADETLQEKHHNSMSDDDIERMAMDIMAMTCEETISVDNIAAVKIPIGGLGITYPKADLERLVGFANESAQVT